ncbi:MAG: methyltransferase domain-containing protein [Rhodocyclaceae bacterium]
MTYSLPMILKAIASNQIARFAPGLYVKMTGQTGRGDSATETSADIAQYFRQCVTDYLDTLGIPPSGRADFLQDKVVLEYGPGDIPGVALLLVAYGARKVYCVDRFPLVSIASKNLDVIHQLANTLSEFERQRFDQCFKNPQAPEEGFNSDRIEYLVRPNGMSGLEGEVDIVISRAVLEHVNDLDATFDDMLRAMKPGARSVHQVDLRSHGLHVSNPLDFLAPPNWLWQLMHSHKGVPNRWRADRYEQIIQGLGVELNTFQPTVKFDHSLVATVRPALATPFRKVGDEQLAWQGFWLAFRKGDNHA